ncbi:MAG: flagellar basal body rod C-terminal domain-containing protein [Balneolaceae bacterium]
MLPDRLFSTFQTAAQGLSQQRTALQAAARNIAHAETASRPGAPDAYMPEKVDSQPAKPRQFHSLLRESITTLQRTRPEHLEGVDSRSRGIGQERGGFGPSHEVVRTEQVRMEYDPTHPDADEEGMVQYPEIDMIRETVNMVKANRLYEANLSSIEAEKQMIKRALEI